MRAVFISNYIALKYLFDQTVKVNIFLLPGQIPQVEAHNFLTRLDTHALGCNWRTAAHLEYLSSHSKKIKKKQHFFHHYIFPLLSRSCNSLIISTY